MLGTGVYECPERDNVFSADADADANVEADAVAEARITRKPYK